MKLSTILLVFTMSFSAMAEVNFDNEKPVNGYKDVKVFKAVYNNHLLVAWTALEGDKSSSDDLDKLAKKRANEICQYFGYQVGTIPEDSLARTPFVNESNMYSIRINPKVLLIKDGHFETIENKSDGGIIVNYFKVISIVGAATINLPRFFTEITCAK